MDAIVEARVSSYVHNRWQYQPAECDRALTRMRELARVAGYDLDSRFGRAGLAAGPDARVAAGMVNRALGAGGGSVVSDFVMKSTLERWLRTAPSRRR